MVGNNHIVHCLFPEYSRKELRQIVWRSVRSCPKSLLIGTQEVSVLLTEAWKECNTEESKVSRFCNVTQKYNELLPVSKHWMQ